MQLYTDRTADRQKIVKDTCNICICSDICLALLKSGSEDVMRQGWWNKADTMIPPKALDHM